MGHLNENPGDTDPTASAYIIRTDGERRRILLHQHRILDTWMQFGGHVEHDQNVWQGLAKELWEEAGYGLKQLTVLQPIQRITSLSGAVLHPVPLVTLTHEFTGSNITVEHFHNDTAYGFITTQNPAAKPMPGESQVLELFDEDQLEALPDTAIPPNVREIGLYLLRTSFDEWAKVPAVDFSRVNPSK